MIFYLKDVIHLILYVCYRIVVILWDHLGIAPLISCGWELVSIQCFVIALALCLPSLLANVQTGLQWTLPPLDKILKKIEIGKNITTA